jgi:hypothetical protein
MRPIFRIALALCLMSASAVAGPNSNGTADQQWQSVKNKGEPLSNVDTFSPAGRAQAISSYIADADALKDFYTKNPGHGSAKEAERRETLALLYAESLGDVSQKGRCKQLVKQLRGDPSLDVEAREQLAAFSDNLDFEEQGTAPDKRLPGYEQVARALQKEFPSSVSVYESLMGIADSSADDKAAAIAQDVLTMPAPDIYKASAQILLARQALKGSALTQIAAATLGADNPIDDAAGHAIVLYTWRASVPHTIAVVKQAQQTVPTDTVFIGVCLDFGDLTGARAVAAKYQPPGRQIYDPMGFMGKFAGRAYLTKPGMIYVADRKGVIVSVSAEHDTATLSGIASKF